MFNIVLVEPEIPQNTGNIARTCAATGCRLHLVKPLGFEVSDRYLKRAGLDYWQYVDVMYWDGFDQLKAAYPGSNFYYFTTKARKCYTDIAYKDGDFMVFGKETRGLPEPLLKANPDRCARIPMAGGLRSLNLSNSAAIVIYEGLRQNGFENMSLQGELHELKW